MAEKTKDKLTRMFNGIIDWVLSIAFILLMIELPNKYRIYLIIFLTIYFTYRIWFDKNDIMYIAREQLEIVLFGKPLLWYKKGEKIRMNKFVWRKSK